MQDGFIAIAEHGELPAEGMKAFELDGRRLLLA